MAKKLIKKNNKILKYDDKILSYNVGERSLKRLLDFTESCKNMFSNNANLKDLTGYIEYDDTENVTDMQSMFYECTSLQTLPPFDMSKVTSMQSMFYNCKKLEKLPFINTNSSLSFGNTFNGCNSLIELPPLDTSNCSSYYAAFRDCYILEKIDISRYPSATQTTPTDIMCENCYSLKAFIIRDIDWQNTLSSKAFNNCYHILGIQNSTYNPDGLKDGYIYLPKSKFYLINGATNWVNLKSQIRPIYNVDKFGDGVIQESINAKNETIWIATPNKNYIFMGWYDGVIVDDYIPIDIVSSTYVPLEVTYPFELNANGYYQNTNQNQASTYSMGRFSFNIENENQQLKITYLQSSESGYDYGIIGNVDVALSKDTNTTGYKTLNGISATTPQEIVITNLSVGEHFIDIKYRKDGSGNNGTDTLQVKVEIISYKVEQHVEGKLYSNKFEINIGVVDEKIMNPVCLVALFEEKIPYEQPTQNKDELTFTQAYNIMQKYNILEGK